MQFSFPYHSPEWFAAIILMKIRCRPQTRAANIEYRPFERQLRSQQMKYHEKTQCEHTVCKHGRYIYRCLGMRRSVEYDTSFAEIYLLWTLPLNGIIRSWLLYFIVFSGKSQIYKRAVRQTIWFLFCLSFVKPLRNIKIEPSALTTNGSL